MSEDKDFYKNIIDNLYDGVYFVDRERTITYWNNGAERITGYSNQQVVGHSCFDNLLNHVNAEGVPLCEKGCPLAATIKDGVPREVDVFLHHADGHRVPVLVRAAPMRDADGNIIGAVETFTGDMGVRGIRQEVRDLRRSLQTDKLTGVGNRRFLEGRLRAAIAELGHHTDPGMGLLFIDIDRFKQINDTYSHEAGDKMLRMVASTLQNNLRKSDAVGRWGGEEFLAILYEMPNIEAVKSISEKLRMLVELSSVEFAGNRLSATISIGATLVRPTDSPELVVRRADELMYQSKRAGRNRVSTG